MKKNGFISTTLIYTFFILFLSMMIFTINSYASNRFMLEQYKSVVKSEFSERSKADINLTLYLWNDSNNKYEIAKSIPQYGYEFNSKISYCKNGSTISYIDGNVTFAATKNDSCFAYFKKVPRDVDIKIYTKETASSEKVYVEDVPGKIYKYIPESSSCTNGATIEFNEYTREFEVTSTKKTVCEAIFVRRILKEDVNVHIFKEDINGSHINPANNKKYQEISDIPGYGYTFNNTLTNCENSDVTTNVSVVSGEIVVSTNGKNTCNIYFDGGSNKSEVIYMIEDNNGLSSGFTTGKKYTRSYSIPLSTSYIYVGSKCDNSDAEVTYNGGTFTVNTSSQTTCLAYFDKYRGGMFVHLYLQQSDGTYEGVTTIPSLGYVYNSDKSNCKHSSTIKTVNNIVTIVASTNDECYVYYDLATKDINVIVYVWNSRENKYEEKNKVPVAGYNLYNAGCTNGATIEYKNGILDVTSTGPTVCTVYFR